MRAPILLFSVAALFAPSAQAQVPTVRLAAPADCATNPNCAPGLERTYGAAPPAVTYYRPLVGRGITRVGYYRPAVTYPVTTTYYSAFYPAW